jgi:hypothetical protein
MFDAQPRMEKDASWDSISEFFRNSKDVPIFLLCFAAGNQKGAKTAVNIANEILKP